MTSRFDPFRRGGNKVSVTIPTDEGGFMGRECPQADCEGYFKVKPGTGLMGKNLPCVCPYCGHSGPSDEFFTKGQIEYAQSVAFRKFTKAFSKELKKLEFSHKPKGSFGIGVSMKVKPGRLPPLKVYREKTLETRTTCDQCSLEYSVFGLFAYCPDCSTHNSLQILQKNLNLTQKQIDLATSMEDPEMGNHILEDALENCVSAFDSFGREACRVRADKSSDPSKALSVSFQNLGSASTRMQALFGVNIAALVQPAEWTFAELGFLRRHLLAHRAGVIDQKYIDESGESQSLLGRRLNVSPDDVKRLTKMLDKLGRGIVSNLPSP